jgi:LruC domain-containing protein
MPDASFAGQQETFLNVQGFDAVLVAVKHVFASLFNDRAISYRVHQGYDHRGVALSAGVQRMVRSDLAKPAGSQYYNTEKNALVATSDLPEINILITLKKRKEVKEILEGDEFDLYLKRNDSGTEIHMNGIEPITYQYPFNDKNLLPVYTNGDEEDDNYYFSAGRLIWGLRVPGNAAHAIEKANFLEAYKGFAKWAQSSGKNEQNWYNQGNADKSLLIHN